MINVVRYLESCMTMLYVEDNSLFDEQRLEIFLWWGDIHMLRFLTKLLCGESWRARQRVYEVGSDGILRELKR